jgi:hypothetical protein
MPNAASRAASTNGNIDADGRRAEARRLRDLVAALSDEFGAATESRRVLVKIAATVVVQIEILMGRLAVGAAFGDDVALDAHLLAELGDLQLKVFAALRENEVLQ